MAVTISGVSGVVAQGNSITITGSGFGSHALQHDWLHDNIEAGTNGANFAKTNWSLDTGSGVAVKYATDAAHSRAKSLKAIIDPANNFNGILTNQLIDPVNASDRFYLSWWARYVGQATNLQWKMLRLSETNTIIDSSSAAGTPAEMVFFNWMPSSQSGPQMVIDPGTGNDQTFSPPANVYVSQGGTWYREEVQVQASSVGGSNGSTVITRTGDGSLNVYTSPTTLRTHSNSGDTYSWILFQNYFGNGASGSPTVWFDDIYVQTTWARIELADTATWAARRHVEVQIPTAWNDTGITATIQQGNFAAGPAYLYVLDSNGLVNANGFAVTVGSGGADTTPPSAPTGVTIS